MEKEQELKQYQKTLKLASKKNFDYYNKDNELFYIVSLDCRTPLKLNNRVKFVIAYNHKNISWSCIRDSIKKIATKKDGDLFEPLDDYKNLGFVAYYSKHGCGYSFEKEEKNCLISSIRQICKEKIKELEN